MMKQILSENGINFNDLEKEIFEIACKNARETMVEILESIDENLQINRDKKIYRHKGKRVTTIKTIMGEVEFKRTIYESKNDLGEKAYIYLLDEAIGLETFGKVSTNLAFKIAEHASISSFRNSAHNISSTTGQSISHGGVWNVIQSLGEKLKEIEDNDTNTAANGHITGTKETKILFEEADGVWINMQGKDRPRKGRRSELKVAVAYDGWELESKNRYKLRNKVAVAGFDNSRDFQKRKEGAIAKVFNTDEVEIRILNGDGGGWIKGGLIDETVHFQLDPFHLNRDIVKKVRDKTQKNNIMSLLKGKKVDDALEYINELAVQATDYKENERLTELYNYLYNNKEGIIPYQQRGLDIPLPPAGVVYRNLGTMEHQICDIIAQRMKNIKGSWSKSGAEKLSKILTVKATNGLYEKISGISVIILPEIYTGEVQEILSAAKAPKKDGKGYRYPKTGGMPFVGSSITNGRRAIQSMLSYH